ncbi:hypothetical protein MHYP_G00202240 [Metynnis hypsauchen]
MKRQIEYVSARPTWMCLWMCQDVCLPLLTDLTVVLARPTISPPVNTHGSLVCMVLAFTPLVLEWLSWTGAMASLTVGHIKHVNFKNPPRSILQSPWPLSSSPDAPVIMPTGSLITFSR